jgi:hypothetical protein
VNAAVNIQVYTNGQDADSPTGPYIEVSGAVAWTYVVKNLSNAELTDIVVVDNRGVTVSCPGNTLDSGLEMTCTASGVATAGQYANTGTVTASPPAGADVEASDPSHYYGATLGLSLEKRTNGQEADTAPGPTIEVGGPVAWTYLMTNGGNVTLSGVTVSDSQGEAVTCPKNALAPGESMTCTASGTAVAGQYANIGQVQASAPAGLRALSASDPSHYYGETSAFYIYLPLIQR